MRIVTESDLVRAGLVAVPNDVTKVLAEILLDPEIPAYPYSRVLNFVWDRAKLRGEASGALFELMVSVCLFDAKVNVFYRHALLEGCPKIEHDLLVWTPEGAPWCIQMTSTLRERYKLADLQAFRVKSSYPKAIVVLLTMDQADTSKRSSRDFESLDDLIFCGNESLDLLIERLAFANSKSCENLIESKRTRTVNR